MQELKAIKDLDPKVKAERKEAAELEFRKVKDSIKEERNKMKNILMLYK